MLSKKVVKLICVNKSRDLYLHRMPKSAKSKPEFSDQFLRSGAAAPDFMFIPRSQKFLGHWPNQSRLRGRQRPVGQTNSIEEN